MGMCAHRPQHARGKCPDKETAREFAETKHRGLAERKGKKRGIGALRSK